MNKIYILEIIFVTFLLAAPMIATYLGICCLKLRKKNEQLRNDRDELIESRAEWKRQGKVGDYVYLSETERKLIITALNVKNLNAIINHATMGLKLVTVFNELKKKIKESLGD